MLRCSKCKQWKLESEFWKQSCKARGYRYTCKECTNARAKELRKKNKELKVWRYSEEWKAKQKERQHTYYLANRETILAREKERGKLKTINGARRTDEYRERAREKYNLAKNTPENKLRSIYKNAKGRCENSNRFDYKYYGGRWIKFMRKSFSDFCNDMKESYLEHGKQFWFDMKYTQLDRIDNNWNYCKENCRRVTCKENNSFNHAKEFSS